MLNNFLFLFYLSSVTNYVGESSIPTKMSNEFVHSLHYLVSLTNKNVGSNKNVEPICSLDALFRDRFQIYIFFRRHNV